MTRADSPALTTDPDHAFDQQEPYGIASTTPAPGPLPSPVKWVGGGAALGLAVLWLTLRPASPQGAAAAVDLLVLPAVLFAEARLLAGRPTIATGVLAVLFGLGAVLSSLVALLIEWPAAAVLSPSAMVVFGAAVEVAAPCVPVLIVTALLLRHRREPTVADLALGGLSSGLGFIVVQTSLIAAASHRAPDYASPLVAGWQRIPLPPGMEAISSVGPGVATALVGLAIGVAIRWKTRPWRVAPPLLAIGLVVVDRIVFDQLVGSAVAGAPPPRLASIVRQVTFSGHIELVVLALGLVLLGRRSSAGNTASGALHGGGESLTGEVSTPRVPNNANPLHEQPGDADQARLAESTDDSPAPTAAVRLVRAPVPAVAVAVAAGALFVGVARTGHLGFIQDQPVALAVSAVAFAYSLLRLAALRAPGGRLPPIDRAQGGPVDEEGGWFGDGSDDGYDDEAEPGHPGARDEVAIPPVDGRQLLGVTAVASSALGIVVSLLPPPTAVLPVHGTLAVEAVQGWAAHVGHLGLLFGIGGLAAPPGPVVPQTAGGWGDLLPWRIRSSGWWRGLAPRRRRIKWLPPLPSGGGGSSPDRRSRSPLPLWMRRWHPTSLAPEPEKLVTTSITVAPVDESAPSRIEYEGANVQEAMEAALGHLGAGARRTSVQLVDAGAPPKPGRPGRGRPARVRLMRACGDEGPLLAPGRDSITRESPLNVVVEIVDKRGSQPPPTGDAIEVVTASDAGPPPVIEVVLSGPSHAETRILSGSREDLSAGRARYRSNPYTLAAGEDPAWVVPPATAARGLTIGDGEHLRVEVGDQADATVAVYDDWVRQVIGVNRALFDVAGARHVNAVAALEQRRSLEKGDAAEKADAAVALLRVCLAAVEAGRRLLSSSVADDEKAFLSTAAAPGHER